MLPAELPDGWGRNGAPRVQRVVGAVLSVGVPGELLSGRGRWARRSPYRPCIATDRDRADRADMAARQLLIVRDCYRLRAPMNVRVTAIVLEFTDRGQRRA
jgi:hypothetical protein